MFRIYLKVSFSVIIYKLVCFYVYVYVSFLRKGRYGYVVLLLIVKYFLKVILNVLWLIKFY